MAVVVIICHRFTIGLKYRLIGLLAILYDDFVKESTPNLLVSCMTTRFNVPISIYFSHACCAQLHLARFVTEDERLAGLGTAAYHHPSVSGDERICSARPSEEIDSR